MNRRMLWLALCAGLVFLGGCATQPEVAPKAQIAPDPVYRDLQVSAQRIADAQSDLARMSSAQHPAMVPLGPPMGVALPPEMSRQIYLRWNGDVAPVVKSLARMVGYSYKQVGSPPANPVIVNIDTSSMSVFDVVQEIGMQCGDRAGVLVDPIKRQFVVVWAARTAPIPGYPVGKSW